MSEWRIEEIREFKGFTVEWAENGNFIFSKRNRLFRSDSLNAPLDEIATVEAPIWKQYLSTFRLAQRLLRFMVTNVLPLSNRDLFVTFDKSVGIVRDGQYIPLKGLERPCRVLRSACAIDSRDHVFFGEYLANDDRGKMRVYKYSPGTESLEVAHTFPSNSIKHVHGLYFDRITDSIYCLTGDVESECRILRSTDGCRSFETVGAGDETWRAVSLLFDEESFYYGTDAEHRANHIYRVSRSDFSRTKIGEVSGTVFYSKRVGDDLIFATTAENAPSQKENVAALYAVRADESCRELISFKKDRWHPTYFQFGMIHFPAYSSSDSELYFHLVGVEEDNRVFRLSRI